MQRTALHKRIGEIAEAAALCGVNILCMQEAWSKWCSMRSRGFGFGSWPVARSTISEHRILGSVGGCVWGLVPSHVNCKA